MMITYETTKALKDAGFPQKVVFQAPDCDCENRYIEGCYIPTIAELIEACPGRQKQLHESVINDCYFTLQKSPQVGGSSYHAYYEDFDTQKPVPGFSFRSSTPEEAVASLWLKLNEGNDNRDTNRISETL